MKPANSPVISTSRSLNQALSLRTAAFVMTAIKYKNHSLKLIFQFQVLGGGGGGGYHQFGSIPVSHFSLHQTGLLPC